MNDLTSEEASRSNQSRSLTSEEARYAISLISSMPTDFHAKSLHLKLDGTDTDSDVH